VELVRRTIELALENVENGGRPFAHVSSRDGEVVAERPNLVVQTRDPTAHAEIVAVRQACQRLETENLEGHEIYVLAHPCPMCLGHSTTAARIGWHSSPPAMSTPGTIHKDDRKYFELENFYDEFSKPWQERWLPMEHRPDEEGVEVYRRWRELNP
jgi:guanine deaminase